MTTFKANRKFPNPITVNDDPRSHTLALQQVIEALNIGQRRTKEVGSSYVRVSELVDVGLIEIVGNQLKLTNTGTAIASGSSSLAGLTDVDLTGLADGDVLVWDAGSSTWIPGAASTSIGGGVGYFPASLGRYSMYIPATDIRPSVSGGCASLATVAVGSGQPDIHTIDFDPSTSESAQFSIRMPGRWNRGTITFSPAWSHPATTTNYGVVWSLQGLARGDNEAIGTAFGTAQVSADIGGVTDNLYFGDESSDITLGGTPAWEDMCFFKVARETADAADTLAVDARLHGVTIYMTYDAVTDDPAPYSAIGFTITRSTTWAPPYGATTALPFDTEERDDGGMVTLAYNNSRAYPPIPGYYIASSSCGFPSYSNWYKGFSPSASGAVSSSAGTWDGPDATGPTPKHSTLLGAFYFSTGVSAYLQFGIGYFGTTGTKVIDAGARLSGSILYNFGPEMAAMLGRSATFSISATTDTVCTWNTSSFLVGDLWESVTNPTRVTIPAGGAGWYLLASRFRLASSGSNRSVVVWHRLNGSTNIERGGKYFSGSGNWAFSCSSIVYLADGDYVESMLRTNLGFTVEQYNMLVLRNGLPNMAAVTVTQSASQSLGVGSTTLTYDTVVASDGFTLYNAGSPTVLTVPAGAAGWYALCAYAECDATTGTYRRLSIRVNSTALGQHESDANATYNAPALNAFVVAYLEEGDVVDTIIESGTAANVQAGLCRLTAMRTTLEA